MNKNFLVFSVLAMTLLSLGMVVADEGDGRACSSYNEGAAHDFCTWTSNITSDITDILPLGSEDTANCNVDFETLWELNTAAIATCVFDGTGMENTELHISIDNDVISCTLNGDTILEDYEHEGCAEVDPRDGYSLDLTPTSGTNTIVCEILDRGTMSHFDSCVTADIEDDAPEIGDPITYVDDVETEYPTCEDDVEVCVEITDISDIVGVEIFWDWITGQGSWDMVNVGGDTYCYHAFSASTFGPEDADDMLFSIFAVDQWGNEGEEPEEGMYSYTYDCEAPDADAGGPYECNEGNSVTLDASGSYDSVSPMTFSWDLDDDGNYDDATGEEVDFDCLDGDSLHDVAVLVTDGAGHSDTDTATVTVNNVAPKATANGPYEADEGDSAALSGYATDPAGSYDPLTYMWDLDDDTVFETAGQDTTFECLDGPSVHTVYLKVTDGDGGETTVSTTVTCNNVAPEVEAGEDEYVDEGMPVTIAPTFDDPAGTLDEVYVTEVNWGSGFGSDLTHTYCDGTDDYTVTVRVTDKDGGIGSDTLTVYVNNVAPEFINLPEMAYGVQGDTFSYNVDGQDQGCDDLGYSLQGGQPIGMTIDPNTGMINWPNAIAGDYTVTVRVHDGEEYTEEDLMIHIYLYDIEFDEGWNCFSTPMVPEDDDTSVESVLNDLDVDEAIVWSFAYDEDKGRNVWTFRVMDEGDWENAPGMLEDIVPGYGYYLFTDEESVSYHDGKKMYGGEDNPPYFPAVKVTPGDNLIGHYYMNHVPKHMEMNDLTNNEEAVDNHLATQALFGGDGYNAHVLVPTKCYWAIIGGENVLEYFPSQADNANHLQHIQTAI